MQTAGVNMHTRRGSVYLIVLASAMLVAIIGLASMFAIRVQRRSAQIAADADEARFAAQSAVEIGLLLVAGDPNWRDTRSNGAWMNNKPLGNCTLDLEGVDPQDGDLADSEYEPLVLTGIGAKGIARHKIQVTLVPEIKPLEALNTCLHASGNIKVNGGKQITVVGAPISTNGRLDNDGTIDGDAQAATVATTGTITGTLTVPADAKAMPDPNVISDYIAKATVIPFPGNIDKQILTPTYNPWGPGDPNGVYFIDTGNSDITIKNTRIWGTLIVRTGSEKLTLDNAVFFQNYRSDYPVLIIDGQAEFKHRSATESLSEAGTGTNFNPAGAPYQGVWDTDTDDEYPNEVRGLVHVTGPLTLKDTARVSGAIICEGDVFCDNLNVIIHNSQLYAVPPEGYIYVEKMKISPGSFKQVVD